MNQRHIEPEKLWVCASENRNDLTEAEDLHFAECAMCLNLFRIAVLCDSPEDLEEELRLPRTA